MEIWSGLRHLTPQTKGREHRADELRKKDVISDLFNNQSVEDQERSDVKLRLSRTSRVLGQRLQQASNEFLAQNPEIGSALDRVPLGDESPAGASRKLKAYINWLDIRRPGEAPLEDVSTDEEAYLEVHNARKDEQIRGLFHNYDEERQSSVEQRTKHSPNYYYLAYPETYAFN